MAHIVYLYDEDIKKMIKEKYGKNIEEIEICYYNNMQKNKPEFCYKVYFKKEGE